ncbi:MAG TPA: Flp family type IVb pilin [Pseudobdellovibrionaceae bacterium]|nr:Flp family type IVb pilin [Pseudobdellovibrionaceae bacterium]
MHQKNIYRKLFRSQRGQGLTEYIIIVALIAVGSIGLVRLVGGNINTQFGKVANALAGQNSRLNARTASQDDVRQKNLSNFMTGATSDEVGSSQGARN